MELVILLEVLDATNPASEVPEPEIVEATDVWFESGFVCLGIKRLEYPYVKTVKVLPAHRVKGITKIDGQNPG